jgi:hypothetical protein
MVLPFQDRIAAAAKTAASDALDGRSQAAPQMGEQRTSHAHIAWR